MVAIFKAPCDEQVIAHKVPTRPVPCPKDVGRAVLIATILASSMVFIDSSAVNVALPTLQRELGASAAQAQWVVESYALFLAALLLVGGVLGDRFGRKRIFVLGTVLFAATSVWCGLSPNIEMLIVARAAQGVAAALLTPASLAIISAAFSDETERGRAIGTWSGFTAITAAFGPVLGGWLVENASWRWVFFINLPLAVVVVAVTLRGVPESRDEDAGRLDVIGAVLATIGLGALVFGLIEGPVRGWGNPVVLASLLTGVVGLVAFIGAETRVSSPMMPLGLFRSPTFGGANLLTLLLYGAFGGALFWLPFNLIQVQELFPDRGRRRAAAGNPDPLRPLPPDRRAHRSLWSAAAADHRTQHRGARVPPLRPARYRGKLLDDLLSGGSRARHRDGDHGATLDHGGHERGSPAPGGNGLGHQQRRRPHRRPDRDCRLRRHRDDGLQSRAEQPARCHTGSLPGDAAGGRCAATRSGRRPPT